MMAEATATYIDRVIDEILAVATNVPQPRDVQDAYARIIERIARRSYSLVRRELVRRVNLEPNLYDGGRIDRALQAFEAGIHEIPDAIADRIEVHICECMRRWVRDILRHGLNQQRPELPNRPSEEGQGYGRHLSGVVGQEQRTEPHPMAKENESPDLHSNLKAELAGPGGRIRQLAVRSVAVTVPPGIVGDTEDTHVDRPSAAGAEQEERQADDGELYERYAKIRVKAPDGVRNMIQFLNELRVNPYLRVLQMTGDSVSLALRRPLRLKQVLSEMAGVSEVSVRPGRGLPGNEHEFAVLLGNEARFSGVV